MSRSVIYDMGAVVRKQLFNACQITYRADGNLQPEIRVLAKQFLLNGVSIVFVDIKDDQLLGCR